MMIGDSLLVPISNNHNILSTSSSCNSSSTTTATNTISNNTIDTTTTTTTTTSSSPTSPPAAMVQQQQQQQALKCPRCDSSHTKFCYYNNYSLSQPRHFCKACKRYWTRGGTLRSVPVGGGCRKNKRVKKATPTSSTTAAAASSSTSNIPHNSSLVASPLPATTTATDHLNSLFYGLLPSAAVASGFPTLHLPQMYDQLQPQMSALGIGFSSGRRHDEEGSQLGFGASSLADLQQTGSCFLNNYQPSLNILEAGTGRFELPKQVKVEEGENCNVVRSNNSDGIEWQDQAAPDMNAADSSYLYWSSAIFGGTGWPDIANSSISPMI